MLESVIQDFCYAARRLLRAPGFTITAVLTLAIGIGAVTSVFSLVDGVLLRSLPFPAADRLMNVFAGGTAPLGVYQVASQTKGAIEAAAALNRTPRVTSGMGPAEWANPATVTASFFPLLGARPYLGRLLLPDEDRPGAAPVAVLSHAFWIKHFGGDPAAVGRTVRLDSTDYRIVGVTFPEFQYPASADLWCNLGPWVTGPEGTKRAQGNGWWTLIRLRPGVSPIRAEHELRAALRDAAAAYPTVRGDIASVEPLQGFLVGGIRTGLWILLGAVGLLLLTASTNVASLLVSRIVNRDRELSVRTALGARRARLASMVLAESLLVSLAGGGLGIVLADATFKTLLMFVGRDLPRIVDIHLSVPVLVFAAAISFGAGVLAGLVPALQAARRNPIEGIKGHGRRSTKLLKRPGDALVVTQVALTVVLLSGAGLLGDSFWRLIKLDPGFRPDGVVAASLSLPELRYPTEKSRSEFAQRALARVQAIPGVTSAAVTTGIPLDGGELDFDLPSQLTWPVEATPELLSVLGIPLKRGHWANDPGTVVLDEAAARGYFPGEDPLGRLLARNGRPSLMVVGIAGDTRQESLNQDPPPHLYLPLSSRGPQYLKVVIRTASPASALAGPLRTALQNLDEQAPVLLVEPMSAMIATSLATQRSYAVALGVFALAALALAAIGLYGLIATGVARRTREIGIRIALGAERQNVMRLVLARGSALAGIGLVIGVSGSFVGTRVLKSMLFQVGAGDPVVLAAVVGVLFAATLAATYFPARRAAGVDPLVALRTE